MMMRKRKKTFLKSMHPFSEGRWRSRRGGMKLKESNFENSGR
jgi:hypothetical protein